MKYITAGVLYVIFSAASMLAGAIGLVGLLIDIARGRSGQHTANIMHSMDMLLAALLPFGWDGRSTVSKECGRSSCRFCRALCAVLNRILERDHCGKEAGRR